ncbi:EamA family transporter RarD [Mycolicibacterium sp. NCC-Tsukiji]|uniref:EamA family transporter RarD n=1 Tax=Mycolicibacterium sp. NCC-Tsukiji TaxID=2185272 RepID=UPI000EBA0B55|nr:EamA family transporter RarD [Mycolicibacterium sp. NCC-Tsukiji]GCA96597.1 protein RarD [Mycolicibacterium sp. NCC-Tsukiji]
MTTTATATSNQNRGLLLGLGAYGTWGLFPAFFPLLKPATAFEVLAHRIVWTLLLMFVVLAAGRRLGDLRRLSGRTWGLLVAASALISLNWGIYIYAVSNGHVVDAALGYFINPLVSVALGVAVFGERLNRAQATALAIGAAAVIVLAVQAGEVPAIGLGLAVSFGVYGAVKKVVPADPRVSVGVEAGLAAPFAVAYLVVLTAAGQATVPSLGAGHTVLMMLCGPVTALPLLMFAGAAQRLPLVTMGLLQYLTPALQMAWGVFIGHEPMPAGRWAGFVLIWLALAVLTGSALNRRRVGGNATTVVEPAVAPSSMP